MALCATCHAPADVLLVGRGRGLYRAVTACRWDRPAAHAWTAKAGPVTETPITPDDSAEQARTTLF